MLVQRRITTESQVAYNNIAVVVVVSAAAASADVSCAQHTIAQLEML